MSDVQKTEYASHSRLIRALQDSLRKQAASERVRIIETHISWVLLAGRYAYKIKKAVNLGFLHFSSLQARKFYCEEEIRLNRRLAPRIYLDVIPVGGSSESPVLGAQPAIEYAVRMRRFAISRQLDALITTNKILPQHIDSLAATIAHFHGNLPAAGVSSCFGTAAAVNQAVQQNFEQLHVLLKGRADVEMLATLHQASDSEYAASSHLFGQRLAQGFVRECHGDLHLGNIVLINDQPVPFDGIEFSPALRWIDVISEVAFTVMDLLQHQRADLAWRFLNAYLEATGDYAGMRVLRFYLAYRAMVRAKVSAIRAAQPAMSAQAIAEAQLLSQTQSGCRGYMSLAADCLARKQSALIITHGLPGSGKTSFAQMALERLPAIRLRSDVERKRMFGLIALADSHVSAGVDLYSADISQRTYLRLEELAREVLQAGYTVLVDAAFLQQHEREQFQRLAAELSVPFVIASLQVSTETLRARIMQRRKAANDASEADLVVLEKLLRTQQPLSSRERGYAADFINEGAGFAADLAGWSRLQQMLH